MSALGPRQRQVHRGGITSDRPYGSSALWCETTAPTSRSGSQAAITCSNGLVGKCRSRYRPRRTRTCRPPGWAWWTSVLGSMLGATARAPVYDAFRSPVLASSRWCRPATYSASSPSHGSAWPGPVAASPPLCAVHSYMGEQLGQGQRGDQRVALSVVVDHYSQQSARWGSSWYACSLVSGTRTRCPWRRCTYTASWISVFTGTCWMRCANRLRRRPSHSETGTSVLCAASASRIRAS